MQGELIGAMRKVFKTDDFELYGAGRTDAGVHALEQIAHLDVKTMLGPEIIRMKVNDELPADVNLIEVEKTHANFHARHDATARSYLYQISRRRTALGKRYVWWIKDKLDVRKMEAALHLFVGMNDMRSFTDDDPEAKSTKVLIDRVEIKESGALILIRLIGSHFVWKLVRRVVGVTAEVGRGKLSLDDLKRFLAQQSPEPARLTAPPSGLFLERIYYKGDKSTSELRPVLHI